MTGVEVAVIAGAAITVGDVMMVAGMAMSAMAAMSQGKQQKKIAAHNARMAQQEATLAKQQAAVESKKQLRRMRHLTGKQQVEGTVSGGVTSEGSLLQVMSDDVRTMEHDRQMIIHQGSVRAVRAQGDAAAQTYQGKMAEKNGYMNAAGSLFSGVGQYGLMKQKGK